MVIKTKRRTRKRKNPGVKRGQSRADRFMREQERRAKISRGVKRAQARKKRPTGERKRPASKRGNRLEFGKTYRPRLKYTRRGWSRTMRSRLMPKSEGPIRVNPKRRKRYVRKNPAMPKFMRDLGLNKVTAALPLTGGLIIGFYGIPVFNSVLPANMIQYRKFFGIGHWILGLALGMVKGNVSKQVASGIIAMGTYDLIASNFTALELPQIPETNPVIQGLIKPGDTETTEAVEGLYGPLTIKHMGGSYETLGPPVSAAARAPLGASYSEYGVRPTSGAGGALAASYHAPQSSTAGLMGDFGEDDPYAGCF